MADIKPRFPIRRFDVFADYQLLKNEADGMPERQAKGRAIWAAKVVAGRRGGGAPPAKPPGERGEEARSSARAEEDEEFRSAGGELQTDRTFDHDIVDRMGQVFYDQVFHPAIAQAFAQGKRYEDIRDTIRKDWK